MWIIKLRYPGQPTNTSFICHGNEWNTRITLGTRAQVWSRYLPSQTHTSPETETWHIPIPAQPPAWRKMRILWMDRRLGAVLREGCSNILPVREETEFCTQMWYKKAGVSWSRESVLCGRYSWCKSRQETAEESRNPRNPVWLQGSPGYGWRGKQEPGHGRPWGHSTNT